MLISETELSSKKSRDLIPLACLECGKPHFRTKNIVLRVMHGNLKNTLKGCYCSRKCLYSSMRKTEQLACYVCHTPITRVPSELQGKQSFCSSRCSALHHGAARSLKARTQNNCLYCGTPCKRSYCSSVCAVRKRQKAWIENAIQGKAKRTPSLRRFLIKTRGLRCEICGVSEWLDNPILLILDHISGNSNDNSLTNLRLICSNCDSTLPTYKAKNKGNGRAYRRLKVEPV